MVSGLGPGTVSGAASTTDGDWTSDTDSMDMVVPLRVRDEIRGWVLGVTRN